MNPRLEVISTTSAFSSKTSELKFGREPNPSSLSIPVVRYSGRLQRNRYCIQTYFSRLYLCSGGNGHRALNGSMGNWLDLLMCVGGLRFGYDSVTNTFL